MYIIMSKNLKCVNFAQCFVKCCKKYLIENQLFTFSSARALVRTEALSSLKAVVFFLSLRVSL